MKLRILILALLVCMTSVASFAETAPIVQRLSTEEIVQNQTPSAVAYNLVYAILQRDFYRVLSYAEPRDAEKLQEFLREKYPDFQAGVDYFFSIEDFVGIYTWQQALNDGYEIVVTDTEAVESQQDVRVHMVCCPSTEVGRVAADAITRYNDTHLEIILRRLDDKWFLHDLYFMDGTEVESMEVADADDILFDADDTVIEIVEPEVSLDEAVDDDVVFKVVEIMPSFPGGDSALMRYLAENVRYPAITSAVQGRVIVQFIVEKDGSISNVEVMRTSGEECLDREAVRVVRAMPKWTPGKQRGKLVRVQYTVPINFRLQ